MVGDWADIAVCRDGLDYYLTQSSGLYRPGALLWHSRDLRRWVPVGHAVREFDACIWVTDLVKLDGRWHLLFLKNFDWQSGGHVVTADRIDGPWSEPRPSGLHPDCVIGEDEDGGRYAFLGRGYVCRLRPGTIEPAEEPRRVFDGWLFPEDWAVEMYPCLEAPKITRRAGRWHLLYAQGGTFGPATSHMVISARSRSAYGPWELSPHNPLIRTWSRDEGWWSKGHGELVEAPDGRWYCILHGIRRGQKSLGRCTLMEPIEWTDEGWPRVPDEPPADWDQVRPSVLPLSDEFAGPGLGVQWQAWERMDTERIEVGAGVLALDGAGSDPGASHPLTVQPMHESYTVETEVEVGPGGETAGGLMLFAAPDRYIGTALGPDGVVRRVQAGHKRYPWATDPAAGATRVGLRIVNDRQDARFYYRVGEGEWRIIQPSMDVSFATSTWYNLRPALFACGDGAARFHGFRYTEHA
jgi:beta-xylosidase